MKTCLYRMGLSGAATDMPGCSRRIRIADGREQGSEVAGWGWRMGRGGGIIPRTDKREMLFPEMFHRGK